MFITSPSRPKDFQRRCSGVDGGSRTEKHASKMRGLRGFLRGRLDVPLDASMGRLIGGFDSRIEPRS